MAVFGRLKITRRSVTTMINLIVRPIIDEIKPYIERLSEISSSDVFMFTKADSDERLAESSQLEYPYSIRRWIKSVKGEDKVMPHWSCHDLRRTMRTRMSAYTNYHVAEVMVGNKISDNQETYDHYDYLLEQSEAYHKWWCHLNEITGGF
jgi:integrase